MKITKTKNQENKQFGFGEQMGGKTLIITVSGEN